MATGIDDWTKSADAHKIKWRTPGPNETMTILGRMFKDKTAEPYKARESTASFGEAALVPQIEKMIEVLQHDGRLVTEVEFHEHHIDTESQYEFERDELQREKRALLIQHQKGYRTDEELDREIARIDAALARLVAPTAEATAEAGIRLAHMIDAWRIADTDERRDILTELLDHTRIDVVTKRVTDFVPHAEFAAWFEQSSLQRTARGWLPVAESEKSHPSE